MAKIKLTKGKAKMSKRNVARWFMTSLVILNTAAVIFILLKLYGIDLIEIITKLTQG